MDLARLGSFCLTSRAFPFFSALSNTYSSATFLLLLASEAAAVASERGVPASCKAQKDLLYHDATLLEMSGDPKRYMRSRAPFRLSACLECIRHYEDCSCGGP